MVGQLLFRLAGNGGQGGIGRAAHGAPPWVGIGRIQELPHHGAREIAVRLFHQQQVPVLRGVPQEGQVVFAVAGTLHLAGIGIEAARLAQQVQAHICQRHVLLRGGAVATPFGKPVPEHQRVVCPAQGEQHDRGFIHLDGRGCAHICPTSSGTL